MHKLKEVFSVGLITGSGPIEYTRQQNLNTCPGDPILVLGDSGQEYPNNTHIN